MTSLIFLLATQLSNGSRCPVLPPNDEPRPGAAPIVVGWHDELNSAALWKPLDMENKAQVTEPVRGAIKLELGKVPANWPYEYQWSGITRDAQVDIAKYPFLTANVSQLLGGYAHMDIDVLDASGKAIKTYRSSTLQAGGVSFIDFSSTLDPAIYRLRLRLIVGGSNQGCYATYNWVRFTSVRDGERLKQFPNSAVILEPRILR